MAVRSNARKLSFEILSQTGGPSGGGGDSQFLCRSESDPARENGKRKRHRGGSKKKKKKKNNKKAAEEKLFEPILEAAVVRSVTDSNSVNRGEKVLFEKGHSYFVGGASVITVVEQEDAVYQNSHGFGELRQRNVKSKEEEEVVAAVVTEENGMEVNSQTENPPFEPNGSVVTRLETAGSLDWKRLMAEDPDCEFLMTSKA